MSQQEYKRLRTQICDVLTYCSFPSLGPLTRDRQKNKKCEAAWQKCLLLSFPQCNTYLTVGAPIVRVTLKNPDALHTQWPVAVQHLSGWQLNLISFICTGTLHLFGSCWTQMTFYSCKTFYISGKMKIWQRRRRTCRGKRDEELLHGSTALTDHWDTFCCRYQLRSLSSSSLSLLEKAKRLSFNFSIGRGVKVAQELVDGKYKGKKEKNGKVE